MKIYLSPSSQEANSYSAEGTNEERQCNRIAEAAKTALERNGYTVKKAPEGQSYQKNTQESNEWDADIHMPIHTNAGGSSKGTLALCYSGNTDDKYVKNVYEAVAALTPWADIGIKVRSDLYEINNTKAICVYMEMAFHDKADSAQWIIDNVVPLGEAIAKGMCAADGKKYIAGDGTEVVPPTNSETESEKLKVDGWWGKKTTLALQNIFETGYHDGIVSNQDPDQKKYLLRADSGSWDFEGNGNGSNLIGAMQRFVGVEDDGYMGKITIKAWQKKLGVKDDGYMGENTVKALQKWINKQLAA